MVKKKSTPIEYPPELLEGKSPADQKVFIYMYTNFLVNFDAKDRTKLIIKKLHEIHKVLYETVKGSSVYNLGNTEQHMNLIESVFLKLKRGTSVSVKEGVLDGTIKLSQIAENKEKLYDTPELIEYRKMLTEKFLEQNEANYYDRFDENNRLEGETCISCGKETAICVTMKQTRASDEPMTRFMRCSSCKKQWRD